MRKQQLTYTSRKGLEQFAYIPAKNPLSTRQKEVLILSIQGLSSKEVSSALGIKLETVSTTKRNIYRELGCNRIKTAIDIAIKNGYIERD